MAALRTAPPRRVPRKLLPSTANWVSAVVQALRPLVPLVAQHVLAAQSIRPTPDSTQGHQSAHRHSGRYSHTALVLDITAGAALTPPLATQPTRRCHSVSPRRPIRPTPVASAPPPPSTVCPSACTDLLPLSALHIGSLPPPLYLRLAPGFPLAMWYTPSWLLFRSTVGLVTFSLSAKEYFAEFILPSYSIFALPWRIAIGYRHYLHLSV